MAIQGITLDTSDVLAHPPSVVIYGPPGVGKSTEMARAFQNVLYVQSSPTILHAYAHWIKLNPQLGLSMPEKVTFDETYASRFAVVDGRPNKAPTTTALMHLLTTYVTATQAGTNPYDGIVFDEWNTICERVFTELKTDPWGTFTGRSGKFNIFAAFDAFKGLHRQVLSLPRLTKKLVGFVSHHQGPRIDDDEASPTRGSIKWLGGPKMPQGLSDQIVELCADADVVLQLVVQDPKLGLLLPPSEAATTGAPLPAPGAAAPAAAQPNLTMPQGAQTQAAATPLLGPSNTEGARRVFLTSLDTKWFRKVRGFNVAAEEILDIHQHKGLRELLRRAGYSV